MKDPQDANTCCQLHSTANSSDDKTQEERVPGVGPEMIHRVYRDDILSRVQFLMGFFWNFWCCWVCFTSWEDIGQYVCNCLLEEGVFIGGCERVRLGIASINTHTHVLESCHPTRVQIHPFAPIPTDILVNNKRVGLGLCVVRKLFAERGTCVYKTLQFLSPKNVPRTDIWIIFFYIFKMQLL